MVVVVGQSDAGRRRPMDQDLDHKMVGKEQVHRLAMDFLVRSVAYSPSEAVAYLEAVVYFPCEAVVVRPSSEVVDWSMEVVDHNYDSEILPRG